MGRLQRDHSPNTTPVSTFAQVLYRHGALMGSAALVLLVVQGGTALDGSLTAVWQRSEMFLLAMLVILAAFVGYLKWREYTFAGRQWLWIGYLLYISVVEEIAFRLYLPVVLESQIGWVAGVLLSNLIFGVIHYYTLRWKFSHCVVAALGGIGLSRLLAQSGDLGLIILVHFVATFLNTPRPPDAPARMN
ncbi:MAG: hypothetical protein CMP86_05730 [Gammaproteobacteria bacterium]|jgi:membrane protease YdiL (CAAX protease family)|nr:hypothetical protein [Gammaproteobacteria bacterium]